MMDERDDNVEKSINLHYKRSNIIAQILFERINRGNFYISIATSANRLLFTLITVSLVIANGRSDAFRIYEPKLFVLLLLVLIGATWAVERAFANYSRDRIERALVTSEMSEIGRDYNPWASAYIQARREIEAFGGNISVSTMLDFEPVAWIAVCSIIVYLC